jgi:hypothetical protein
VNSSSPLSASHTGGEKVRSDAAAILRPSGLNATVVSLASWPLRMITSSPVWLSHTVTPEGSAGAAKRHVLRGRIPSEANGETISALRDGVDDPRAFHAAAQRFLRFGQDGAVHRPGHVHGLERQQDAAPGVDVEVGHRGGTELPGSRDADLLRSLAGQPQRHDR